MALGGCLYTDGKDASAEVLFILDGILFVAFRNFGEKVSDLPGTFRVRLILVSISETDWESVKIKLKLTDNDETGQNQNRYLIID